MAIHYGGGSGGGSGASASDKYLVGDALTDDSIRMIATNGMFQLQKRVDGVWITLIESDVAQTVISDSVKTGVGSLHLGDVHSVGSAAENVIFKNENTGVSWFPVWQGITTDGVTVTGPSSRIYQAKIASQPVGATAAASGQIDYSFQTTFASNTSVFAVKIVAAETYTGKGFWSASYTNGKEISYFPFEMNCVAGTIIDIPFKYPLDARSGAVVNVQITKADGSFLKVRASSTQPTQPWRELAVRVFSDSGIPVDYNTSYEYQAGSKAVWSGINVVANASIPVGTAFSWGTSGATWKPDLAGTSLLWRGVWASTTNYAVNDFVATSSTSVLLFACGVAITSSVGSPITAGVDQPKWTQRVYGGANVFSQPAKDWLLANAYSKGTVVRYAPGGDGLFVANDDIPSTTTFAMARTGATWRSMGSHGYNNSSTYETDSTRITVSSTPNSSAGIYLGGYAFRIYGTDTDLKLEVARLNSTYPNSLYFDIIKNVSLLTSTYHNLDTMDVVGTYYTVAPSGFNITSSYQSLRIEVSSRDTNAARWTLTLMRNGNAGAYLTGQYWGILRANS